MHDNRTYSSTRLSLWDIDRVLRGDQELLGLRLPSNGLRAESTGVFEARVDEGTSDLKAPTRAVQGLLQAEVRSWRSSINEE